MFQGKFGWCSPSSLFNLLVFSCRVRGRQIASLAVTLEIYHLKANPGGKERDLRGSRGCDQHPFPKYPKTLLIGELLRRQKPVRSQTTSGCAEGIAHHGEVLEAPELHAAVVLAVSQEAHQAEDAHHDDEDGDHCDYQGISPRCISQRRTR